MKIFTLLFAALFLFIAARHNHFKRFSKKTGFVFVPSGHLTLNDSTININAFFMLNHEVTNAEYYQFIKEKYLDKGDLTGAKEALPDTLKWIDTNLITGYMQPMANLYFSHPAYGNYPVVNVSEANAIKYCNWLTIQLKNSFPDMMINDVRLPLKSEWVYAARGGLKNSPYPWGGPYTRNIKGCYLANFNTIGDHNITANKEGKPEVVPKCKFQISFHDDMVFGPAIIKSYHPNGYGLYNMAGNVAEMVADESVSMGGHWHSFGNDIQVTSQVNFSEPNPYVGFRPVITFLSTTRTTRCW